MTSATVDIVCCATCGQQAELTVGYGDGCRWWRWECPDHGIVGWGWSDIERRPFNWPLLACVASAIIFWIGVAAVVWAQVAR